MELDGVYIFSVFPDVITAELFCFRQASDKQVGVVLEFSANFTQRL